MAAGRGAVEIVNIIWYGKSNWMREPRVAELNWRWTGVGLGVCLDTDRDGSMTRSSTFSRESTQRASKGIQRACSFFLFFLYESWYRVDKLGGNEMHCCSWLSRC